MTYQLQIRLDGNQAPTPADFSTTFDSPADTLTLARTVCEAIQSIPAKRGPRKGTKRAASTAQTPQLV